MPSIRRNRRPVRRVARKGKKSYYRKSRPMRSLTGVPDMASLSETIDFGALNVGTSYSFNDVQLAQFTRAVQVAQGYQFFKIKSLCYKIQPLLDTFVSTGNTQVPYFYWMINRTANGFPVLNKQWYLDNGAKGIRMDDKMITIRYTPSIIVDSTEAAAPGVGNQANLPKRAPWLTTNRDAFAGVWNPSQVSHCGHFQSAFSEGSAVPITYRITLTAEFVFKKPLAKIPASDTPGATPVIDAKTLLATA